jgi:predicted small integral membrane protein
MIEARIAKLVMVGCLALFALLVAFDNLTDYDTNYAFVRHVLSMDTTFPGNALLYPRITSPALWQAGYALIIAGEGATGIVLANRGDFARPTAAREPHPLQPRKAFRDSPARHSVLWCGFSVLWWSAANGLRCGSRRCGMAKRRRFAFT